MKEIKTKRYKISHSNLLSFDDDNSSTYDYELCLEDCNDVCNTVDCKEDCEESCEEDFGSDTDDYNRFSSASEWVNYGKYLLKNDSEFRKQAKNLGLIKITQENNPKYNYYDDFLVEFFSDKIKQVKTETQHDKNHFDQDWSMSGGTGTDYNEISHNSGTETIEVHMNGKGIINCPKWWLENQLDKTREKLHPSGRTIAILELEDRLNKDIENHPEFYTEGFGGIWADISELLEETEHINIDDKEDSAQISIISLNSISDTQVEIYISVSATREAHGDMLEPNYDEDY
jgi:hypothetical protein|tara:strand:- start:1407 stop:2270 length:864 start_codon:yes stop_codon:yes gene_type:complete